MTPHAAGDPHGRETREGTVHPGWWSVLLGPLATALPTASPTSSPTGDDLPALERRWSDGPGALTGRADGPALAPPVGIVERVDALGHALEVLGAGPVDAIAALALRSSTHGVRRNGRLSCGGATRLLRVADGWIALSLARDDDRALLGALLEAPVAEGDDGGERVAALVRGRRADEIVARGALLGLPLARLGETATPTIGTPAVGVQRSGPGRRIGGAPRVVDLSSLWAGPLCGRLLAAAGAEVTKVESAERPDGARSGPVSFFEALDDGKQHHSIALSTEVGRTELREVIRNADVVIEASRPRALEQLGIDRAAMVREHGVSVWISITGHGLDGPGRDRVAFGDDAAVAGGMVAWEDDAPVFCADAIADPLTGMTAAIAALLALRTGGGWNLDVPLARVAAAFAGGDR